MLRLFDLHWSKQSFHEHRPVTFIPVSHCEFVTISLFCPPLQKSSPSNQHNDIGQCCRGNQTGSHNSKWLHGLFSEKYISRLTNLTHLDWYSHEKYFFNLHWKKKNGLKFFRALNIISSHFNVTLREMMCVHSP